VSEPALSLSFFEPTRRVHGTLRSALTLLFEDQEQEGLPGGAEIEASNGGWRARLADRLELEWEPVSEAADLGGVLARVCRVHGKASGSRVDCFGTATVTTEAPAWGELDALRSVSAIFDEQHALLALARRPHGVPGHGHEEVRAFLVTETGLQQVEDARISTVYDADGRQRTAGLELWMPGEDFPRRGSGSALTGTSLELEGLRVHAAVFDWRLEGREGVGSYEIAVRNEPEAA
jgi:hypothetical protein